MLARVLRAFYLVFGLCAVISFVCCESSSLVAVLVVDEVLIFPEVGGHVTLLFIGLLTALVTLV